MCLDVVEDLPADCREPPWHPSLDDKRADNLPRKRFQPLIARLKGDLPYLLSTLGRNLFGHRNVESRHRCLQSRQHGLSRGRLFLSRGNLARSCGNFSLSRGTTPRFDATAG